MDNDQLVEITQVNNHLGNTPDEEIVKLQLLHVLSHIDLPLQDIECLWIINNADDNEDMPKDKWHAYFIIKNTKIHGLPEDYDFFIDVSLTPSGVCESRCYTVDKYYNVTKILYE